MVPNTPPFCTRRFRLTLGMFQRGVDLLPPSVMLNVIFYTFQRLFAQKGT